MQWNFAMEDRTNTQMTRVVNYCTLTTVINVQNSLPFFYNSQTYWWVRQYLNNKTNKQVNAQLSSASLPKKWNWTRKQDEKCQFMKNIMSMKHAIEPQCFSSPKGKCENLKYARTFTPENFSNFMDISHMRIIHY